MPLALSDNQRHMVMQAATPLPPEKRDVFLWRVSGYFDVHALRRPTDEQVGIAIRLALQGLVQRTQNGGPLGSFAPGESFGPPSLKQLVAQRAADDSRCRSYGFKTDADLAL
jgi:hypothetical protein